MDRTTRICRKCLLQDMEEYEILQSIRDAVSNMSESDRVPPETYERRIQACRQCDELIGGTCMLCGCYVELRAAMRYQNCPDEPPRW